MVLSELLTIVHLCPVSSTIWVRLQCGNNSKAVLDDGKTEMVCMLPCRDSELEYRMLSVQYVDLVVDQTQLFQIRQLVIGFLAT